MSTSMKKTAYARSRKPAMHLLALAVGMTCLLQACAIPQITNKEADTMLPSQFAATLPGTETSAAAVDWQTFFEDPNLSALIGTAIDNNKEVQVLLQRIAMAANEVQARRGEYLPGVGAAIGGEVEKVGEFTRNGAVERGLGIREGEEFPEPLANLEAGLYAAWEIDVWQKLRKATQAAMFEYLASVEGRNFLVTNLVAEVANDYYELMALDNQLGNLDNNIAIQRNALDVTRELLNFGRANSLAVNRFEAEVSKNESERYAIQQRIAATENHLNLLLGRTPQPIPRSSDALMQLAPKMLDTGIPSQLLANRPDIRRAELELAAADLNVDVARANFYPSFELRAGVGFEAFDAKYLLDTPASTLYSIAGDAVLPLINRNAITALYKDANAAQIAAAYDYEQTIIAAFAEVATQLTALDNLEKNYALKTSQVEALNASVDVAGQLFTSARADYLEVLLAQREALEARSELIETRQKQMTAVVNLYRALGGGWR